MRKSLWITSAGGAVRISIIALACLFLSATGARADTFTYTYTGNDFTTVGGPYTTSDRVTGTIELSAPLPANLSTLTDESSLIVSYSFSDGVQTFTNINSSPSLPIAFATSSGAITQWDVNLASLLLPVGVIDTVRDGPVVTDIGEITTASSFGENVDLPGVWSGPVRTVPEPGALSLMLSGLLGLGMLVGVKRYRGNHLSTEA